MEEVAEALFGKDTKRKEIFEDAVKKGKEERPEGSALGSLGTSIAMLGITAMLGNIMMGGMMKMFGGDKSIEPRELVTAMIDGFMVYIEEGREKLKEKETEVQDLKERLQQKEEHYEDALAMAKEKQQEAEKFKSLYMQQVSKSRKTKSKKSK